MDFKTLLSQLNIANGALAGSQVQINNNSLTTNIGDLIDYCYANQPITINGAQLQQIDEENQFIIIRGTSDFLNVPSAVVEVYISLDDKGDVQLILRYQVLGETAGTNDWKFSKSFPNMPKIVDQTKDCSFDRLTGEVSYPEKYPLDDYYFYNTYFVVTSQAQEDANSGKPLQWGINFMSKMRPEGALGIAKSVFGFNLEIDVYGTIRIPRQEDNPEQLRTLYKGSKKQFQFPWTVAEDFDFGLPGILLQIDLGVDFIPIKDKLEFKAEKFYIYTPTEAEWAILETNPQFVLKKGYTGSILLPEAAIEVDILIPDNEGYSNAIIISHFNGVSISNISHLAGISGGDSPLQHLPDQIKEVGEELGKLTLESGSLEIDYYDLTDIKVSYISFTVGMPDLNWVVWKDHFEINELSFEFDIANPMATLKSVEEDRAAGFEPREKKVSLKMRGAMELENIPFSVYAAKDDDFEVFAEISGSHTIPLKALIKKYFKGLTPPGDLTIDTLRFGARGSHHYSFAMAMADKPNTWSIPIGNRKFEVYDVYMSANYNNIDGTYGTIGGTIAFDDIATLYLQYASPGKITIKSYLEEIKIKKLIETLGGDQLPVPKAFDLELKDNTLLLQEASESFTLQLATELQNFGTLALQLQNNGAQTGVAFGVNMTQGHPFDIPGLSELKAFSNALRLENFLLVVSTFDAPAFQFPGLANFNNPMLSSTSIPMPKGSTGVIKGLNIHALWTLDTEDKAHRLLRQILGLNPSLDVTLQVSENPSENSRLYLKYNTKIAKHNALECKFGVALQGGTPELFLEGILHTKIQKHACVFDVAMSLLANGIYFAGSMEGTVKFEGIQLSNMAFALGFDWECIPSIGVAATIDTPNFDSSVAILFDSIDPQKSLLAGAISDISLADIIEMFVQAEEKALGVSTQKELIPSSLERILNRISLSGTKPFKMPLSVAESLDHMDLEKVASAFLQYGHRTIPSTQASLLLVINQPGKRWSITDKMNHMRHYELKANKKEITVYQEAQIYMCPQRSQMGDLVFQEGFYLTGSLNLFGLHWESEIEINKTKGISASSAINKKLVIFNSSFFELSDFTRKTGPSFSLSTYHRPEAEDKTLQSPHFCLSGELCTLGLTRKAYIMATTKGMSFEIDSSQKLALPGKVLTGSVTLDFNLHGIFDKITNFDAGMSMDIHLKGTLHLGKLKLFGKNVDFGNIALDLAVGASIDMGYNGKKAFIKFKASFEFNGSKHHISLELKVKNADITKAGEWILDALKGILEGIYEKAEEWLSAVGNGFVVLDDDLKQAAVVLKDGFDKADKEAAKLLHDAGHGLKEIGSAMKTVFETPAKDFANTMKDIGAETEEIGNTMKDVFMLPAEGTTKIFKDLGIDSKDVATTLKKVFKIDTKSNAKLLKKTFGLNKNDLSHALHGAGYSSKEVKKVTKSIFKSVKKDVNKAGKTIKKTFHL